MIWSWGKCNEEKCMNGGVERDQEGGREPRLEWSGEGSCSGDPPCEQRLRAEEKAEPFKDGECSGQRDCVAGMGVACTGKSNKTIY